MLLGVMHATVKSVDLLLCAWQPVFIKSNPVTRMQQLMYLISMQLATMINKKELATLI